MSPAPNPLGLLADVPLPPSGPLANLPAWLPVIAGACVCMVFMVVAAAIAFLIFKRRGQSPAEGEVTSSGGGKAAVGGKAPANVDEAAAVEAAMKAALAEDIDHIRAQEVLGPYMVLLAGGKPHGEAAERLKRLANAIEEALTVKKYNPSVMAEFGLDRMRILAEINRSAHRIGDNNRVLVLLDGQPRAATLEQLWDLVMEYPDRCDTRSGAPFGVPAALAEEMLKLSRSR